MINAIKLLEQYTNLLEIKCRPGFKSQAGKCVRMSSQEKMNRKRAAKITGRKLRKKEL